MNAVPGTPPLGALERLASRASGVVSPDLVLPRIPSLFETPALAATSSEQLADVDADRPARSARQHTGDDDNAPSREWPAAAAMRTASEQRAPLIVARTAPPSGTDGAQPVRRAPPEPAPPMPRAPLAALAPPRAEARLMATPAHAIDVRAESRMERPSVSTDPTLRTPAPRQALKDERAASAKPGAHGMTVVHQHISAIEPRRPQAEARHGHAAIDRPAVHVTIGRVEIRASSLSSPTPAKPDSSQPRGEPGLSVYLRRRALGSRS